MSVWLHAEVRTAPGSGPDAVRDWLQPHGDGAAAITNAGGSVWGLWDGRPGLGFRSDQMIVSTCWPDDTMALAGAQLLESCPALVDATTVVLSATRRPTSDEACTGAGIWVFRDFEASEADAERFVELSTAAWQTFETSHDARIFALFRRMGSESGATRFLLVTRYADLATWETSRSPSGDPDAWARFAERHGLTRWTRGRSAIRVDLLAPR
jgi:hypothetical protein